MAQSGWYDDPDGTPGRLRYFDGTQWTNDTMPVPGTSPSATSTQTGAGPAGGSTGQASTPTAPYVSGPSAQSGYGVPGGAGSAAGYGQGTPVAPYGSASGPGAYGAPTGPGYGPHGPAQPPLGRTQVPAARPRKRGNLLLGAAAGLGLVYLATNLLGGGGGQTGPVTTTSSSAPATVRTTPLPTRFPTVSNPPVNAPTLAPVSPGASGTLPTMAVCPDPLTDAVTDGALTARVPNGWKITEDIDNSPFQCGQAAVMGVTQQWAMSAIAGATPKDGKTAQQTAEAVWQWNAATNYGKSNPRPTVKTQEAVTVNGLKGYKMTGEIAVSGVQGVTGDVVQVLTLDRADGSHSTLLTVHVIGDAQGATAVDQIWKSVQVKP